MTSKLEIRSIEDDTTLLSSVLSEHWVMGLATVSKDGPQNTPVFYAVADTGKTLLFMSRSNTDHINNIMQNPRVAASMFLETKQIGVMRGVQIRGFVECLEGDEKKRLEKIYYQTHSAARALKVTGKSVQLYALRVQSAKLIDTRLGFGKHILWDSESKAPSIAPNSDSLSIQQEQQGK